MNVSENPLASLLCLVVDDDPFGREMLTATLKGAGIQRTILAKNGSEAFATLASGKHTIDVVLSDVRMPSGNGLQLLHALRTGLIRSMRSNATFVLVTAFPTPHTVQCASSLDANGFVVKPLVPDKLQAALLKARRTIFPPTPGRYSHVLVPGEV